MAEWPDATALERWIGPGHVGGDTTHFAGIVAAATLSLRGLIDPAKLPVEPTDCPDDLRTAILLYAHRLTTRPSSANGVIGAVGADFAIRVGRSDPDVAALIQRFTPDLEP